MKFFSIGTMLTKIKYRNTFKQNKGSKVSKKGVSIVVSNETFL